MAEERLAEAVRKYPVLCDKSDKYFKDKNKKLFAWENKIPFLSRSLNISLTHILRTFFASSCFRLRILRFSSKYPKASKSSSSFIFPLPCCLYAVPLKPTLICLRKCERLASHLASFLASRQKVPTAHAYFTCFSSYFTSVNQA